ncbi:MAG: tetratricopeptide repeat protein [Planctomycetaceae bacterium]
MRRVALIVVLLTLGTLFVYLQTTGFGMIVLDDANYVEVTAGRLTQGLTLDNVGWAFRTGYFANWHPLTWLSYMLDAEIHRAQPGRIGEMVWGFHATNVALHLANVLLLFFILRGLTGADWKSAAVAGLFAVHPIHVESVAWISERKDVLSTFFGLLAIGAYAKYASASGRLTKSDALSRRNAKSHHRMWYAMALIAYAASLMSKQTLVTLPFALLLLDWWPLRRTRNAPFPPTPSETAPGETADELAASDGEAPADEGRRGAGRLAEPIAGTSWSRLIAEKLPFLALALAAAVAVVIAQRDGGAVQRLDRFDMGMRLMNALLVYGLYSKNLIWPADLAVYYPHPRNGISLTAVAISGAIILTVTIFCIALRRRQPWLPVGWFWYLGTLVPMIGLVQVGIQQRADRYMYVPAIGAYVAAVWFVSGVLTATRLAPRVRVAIAVGIAAACFFASGTQARRYASYWKDSVVLFEHALRVTDANPMAHSCLGSAYEQRAIDLEREAKPAEAQAYYARAIEQFQAAEALDPRLSTPHINFGRVRLKQGRADEALRRLEPAAELHSDRPDLQVDIGDAYRLKADDGSLARDEANAKAEARYRRALEILPDYPRAHRGLAAIRLDQDQPEQAFEHVDRAVRANPHDWEAHHNAIPVLLRLGRPAAALHHATEAKRLNPALNAPADLLRAAE